MVIKISYITIDYWIIKANSRERIFTYGRFTSHKMLCPVSTPLAQLLHWLSTAFALALARDEVTALSLRKRVGAGNAYPSPHHPKVPKQQHLLISLL
jgi:hypothetical protein